MAARRLSSKSSTAGERVDLTKVKLGPKRSEVVPKSRLAALLKRKPKQPKAEKAPKSERIDPSSPWAVSARQFPRALGVRDQLRYCLRYALLAPSSHNTQPWRFRLWEKRIEVRADRTRALPVCDPNDRELTISVGCALMYLRVAMRRFGLGERTELMPDAGDPDLMAVVHAGGGETPDLQDIRMLEAALDRRTVRSAFEDRPPPATLLGAMREASGALGVEFTLLADDDSRRRLAKLVAEADIVQLNQRAFRRELAMWMHHNRTHAHDGIPGYAFGLREVDSIVAPLVVRTFDVGQGRAAKDEQLALHSPVLAVLGTMQDTATAWLNTGQALASVLLRGAAEGVSASYLNQPVELAETREHVRRLAPDAAFPQIVLRMGYSDVRPPHTPRRGLEEVLISDLPPKKKRAGGKT